ncbi:N-acetyl-gamma-glutamyl-phosphate reductase [Ammonifex thiophilus]|uniref:N-acetyl-gamma-glutamyl-phosphate reductase n=1 Tax=Ammonifex thiophilus TaxID=444093 RepID=A0A3D8P6K9_9THEO|nr:N-acetyl-gamma-glutamyl-phosphate reductase [Ammonifex thiophilus]RDV84208.1 N-acetyl-gamma-glutamyl-phosphate reductase [Ammonifex thiophilus]
MVRVGIVGASGYTGAELIRLLRRHPEARVCLLAARTHAGKSLPEVFPQFWGLEDERLIAASPEEFVREVDVLFTALPAGEAIPYARAALEAGKKLIDLGADFRFREAGVYERWYGISHGAPELLREAVYGLPELYRDQIKTARLVANPGCYPTAVLLALVPPLKAGQILPEGIVVDAKSGVSGAGRQPKIETLYAEVNENVQAYNVAVHRHTPEMEQILRDKLGKEVRLTFVPHLVPQTRGILATIYAPLAPGVTTEDLLATYREYYREEPFVKVLPAGVYPRTKSVWGSNLVQLGAVADGRTGRAVLLAALDNLVKGAAGQAVQNFNLSYGFPETMGLEDSGIYP